MSQFSPLLVLSPDSLPFNMQLPLSPMPLLVCVCVCVWVRCQHFIRNRSADGLSPHLKDAARRGEAHLCHGWHFNLSLLAVLFPSIVHQCIRTNAMGHKGISGFDIIDTHLWLRLQCCSCRGNQLGPIRCVERGEKRRGEKDEKSEMTTDHTRGDNRKVKSSNIWISIKVKAWEVIKRPARELQQFPKAILHFSGTFLYFSMLCSYEFS